jgi:hypothetical protein
MSNVDYTTVLRVNYPGAQWTLDGDTYDGLTWLDDTPQPTQTELDAAWPQVQYGEQCLAVEAARLLAYEQTSDPLYFKWQRGDGTQEEWLAAVAKVKADNPYPSAP